MAETVIPNSSPDCWKCRHFAITYEPRWPYMCRLMGFKGRHLPAQEVLLADGRPCQGFVAKSATASTTGGAMSSAPLPPHDPTARLV